MRWSCLMGKDGDSSTISINRLKVEKFLMSYNALQPGRRIGPEQARKLFTDAFGDKLDDLDKKFQSYLKSLPVPVAR